MLLVLTLCLFLPLGGCFASKDAGGESSSAALSPAMELLRGQAQLVRCTARYADLAFSEADFCALTGEDTEYIVINSLPAADTGLLMLNGTAVIAGQTIPVSSLNYLKFVPGAGEETAATEAVFTFTAKAPGWENRELSCIVALLDNENFPPVTADLAAETFESVVCFATLSGSDPNGDAVSYTVTSYPRHGTLRLEGDTVVYLPEDGYTGEDSFTYVAKDRYGASSAESTVTFSVVKNDTGLYFADLEKSPIHNAAIQLCADAVMTYMRDGDAYYFSPDETVSKIDCLIMMMCLCGQADQVVAVTDTEATDDTALSAGKKGFLQKAISLGAVYLDDGMFRPDEPVTVADAAYMAKALLGIPTLSAKQTFTDLAATPAWACEALVSADSSGILAAKDGALDAAAVMNREGVAQLLLNMAKYKTGASA